jgi:phosphoketolase
MLPDSLLELRVRPDLTDVLTPDEREALSLFQRLGNYMAAAMIYLRDNALLEEELKVEDIKPRLLGWLVYFREVTINKRSSHQVIGVHALGLRSFTVI